MSPDDVYAPLASALRVFAPPCNGHDVFMSAELTELDRAVCSSTCARCPLLDLCDAYATVSKVDLGFWAGKDRNPKIRRALKAPADRTASGTHRKEQQ